MRGERDAQKALEEKRKRLMREQVLRVILTSEARQRLTNVRLVKPDVAQMIEDHLIQLASSGKIKRPITDDEVKKFLSSIQKPKREFKIRWA